MTQLFSESRERVGTPQGRRFRAALVLIVLAGVGCRLAQYAARASYWHDEALVVLNVMDKTAPQLLGKLDYAQAAPPLFLLAERGLYLGFGASEYVLRLVSLVCGLAAVPLFAALCWRLFPAFLAPWVTAFFGFSDKLIWHSAEVKPYSGDAFCAVLLLYLALGGRSGDDARKPGEASAVRRFILLSLTAAVLLWFSFPAAIVFGGLSLALLPDVLKAPRGALVWLACNAAVGISFLLLYHFSVKPQHVDYLSSFWARDFPPYEHPLRIPLWLLGELYSLCNHPYRSFGGLMALLVLCGVWGAARRQRRRILRASVMPIALAAFAAFLKQYPFNGDRLTIYLVPGLFLLCGEGLLLLHDVLQPRCPRLGLAWLVLAAVVVARGAGEAAYRLAAPRTLSNARLVMNFVRAHREPGQGLYLVGEPDEKAPTYRGGLSLEPLCYWHDPAPPVHRGMPADLSSVNEEQFWVIFGSLPKLGLRGVTPLLRQLKPYATEELRYVSPDADGAAFLFRCKP